MKNPNDVREDLSFKEIINLIYWLRDKHFDIYIEGIKSIKI